MDKPARAKPTTEAQRHEPLAGQQPQLEMLPPHLAAAQRSGRRPRRDALFDFVYSSGQWRQGSVALARRTMAALWILVAIGAGSCLALVTIVRNRAGCRGVPCSVATFGGRPLLTLVLAAAGTVALLAMAVLTRGFTRSGETGLWLLISAACLTVAAVAGILLVVAAVGVVLIIAMLAVTLIFAFFADHT